MKKSVLDSYRDNNLYRLHSLKIKVKENCNLRCRMCDHWRYNTETVELPSKEIMKIVDEAATLSCRQLTITGGEPTLRKDLEEIIARARQHNMRVSLLTNGFAISPARIKSLVASGVSKITISIDYPEPEEHDYIRGVLGAYQNSIDFIRKCVALRNSVCDLYEVSIATCVLRNNLHRLSDMVKLVNELGADAFSVITIAPHNEGGKSLALLPDERSIYQKNVIPQLRRMCREYSIAFRISGISDIYGLSEKELSELPCYFAWANAAITTNGDVYSCCDLINVPGALLGNIKQMRLRDILGSEQAAKVRSLIKTRTLDICRNCYWENDYNHRVHKMCLNSMEGEQRHG